MARVTVGVPVYNGAAYIGAALDDLRRQTFADFEVLIYDNASTDSTAEIARAYAEQDARFQYLRHDTNIGSLPNFIAVLKAARSEYFLWRAMDDSAAPDYIEKLVALLDARPDCDLAVARIATFDLDGTKLRSADVPNLDGDRGHRHRLRLLFKSHPSWIYGVFRHKPLLERASFVHQAYVHPWAWDHLTLFPYLLDFKVVGTNDTTFNQLIKRTAVEKAARKRVGGQQQQVATLEKLRKRFTDIARADLALRFPSPAQRAANEALLWAYVGKRVYRWRRLWQRKIIDRLRGRKEAAGAQDDQAGFEAYF